MKVLFVSPEVAPFAKTGGLADVTGAMPKELDKLGVEVKIMMPGYSIIDKNKFKIKKIKGDFSVYVGGKSKSGTISKCKIGRKIEVIFVNNKEYFDRDGLYGDKNGDYPDNLQRFTFFCKGILEVLKVIGWKPDIIHCHDWQVGLVPAYLKTIYRSDTFYQNISSVFTIHNMAHQGNFTTDLYYIIGLGWEEFVFDKIEFHGKFSLIKAGIVYSNIITTVSESYSREIQTSEFGFGLEGVLKWRSDDLYGIVNGIDYNVWSPGKDGYIEHKYNLKTIKNKAANKRKLLEICGLAIDKDLEVPLIGFISRLAEQKGLDLIEECIEELMGFELQLVVLGTGEEKYETMLKSICEKYPKKISLNLKFDEELAHLIYAGSDMFLMPSKFEPCGLGQLISLKYGTVPIVHKTGGLADTIEEFDLDENSGNGFVFESYLSIELISTIERALSLYKDKKAWKTLVSNCMKSDFSWKASGKKYIELYEK